MSNCNGSDCNGFALPVFLLVFLFGTSLGANPIIGIIVLTIAFVSMGFSD